MSCNAPIATRLTLATLRREKFEGVERALEREAANQVILILVFIISSHHRPSATTLRISRKGLWHPRRRGSQFTLENKIEKKLKMIN